MNLGIGIDTGGTYTDAVIYDYDTKSVLAKGKTLTTKENLAVCVQNALDCLPCDLIEKVKIVALSTTLATNACVENKGGRAKLILLGTSSKVLEWIDAKAVYGIQNEDVICIDSESSFDGTVIDEPDWEGFIKNESEWLKTAQALSIAEVNAMRNDAVCEKHAREKLAKHYDIPIVISSELVSGLNVMERGATALLNAKLLPVIREFMEAVCVSMRARGQDVPAMIVRSDGSLMVDKLSYVRPVETILSGPAASVLGARSLTNSDNCLIVDMGGTTTDISIVEDKIPAMADGIRIGGWRTQIKGVFIDTFGLGGDSRIVLSENSLLLSERRVEPLCMAAKKWPVIKTCLNELLSRQRCFAYPAHEFLYLVRIPRDIFLYDSSEIALIDMLKNGPLMLGSNEIDIYNLKSERLENEGVIMRCGLTPTDVMHIKGDFSFHDKEASILAARYFLNALPQYDDNEDSLAAFCDDVYEMVEKKLYKNIVRVLITNKYSDLFKSLKDGIDKSLDFLIEKGWEERFDDSEDAFFSLNFSTKAALVGIGAPTHIFLPAVSRALKTQCIIPPHAEVANAVGAIVADITAEATVKIFPNYGMESEGAFTVLTENGNKTFDTIEDATQEAKKTAALFSCIEAKKRGVLGEPEVCVTVTPQVAYSSQGAAVDLGTIVTAIACGRK